MELKVYEVQLNKRLLKKNEKNNGRTVHEN